jgi:predicted DNA binding CopG/RHH family protein
VGSTRLSGRSESRQRTKVVGLRLLESEAEMLRAEADAMGVSIQTLIRSALGMDDDLENVIGIDGRRVATAS